MWKIYNRIQPAFIVKFSKEEFYYGSKTVEFAKALPRQKNNEGGAGRDRRKEG